MNQNTTERQSISPESTAYSPIYNNGKKFKIFTAACAIALSVLCGVCFGLVFSTEDMYFESSPLIYMFCGLIAATAVTALIFVLVSKERISPSGRRASAWLGWLTGLELLHLLIILIIEKSWLTALLLIAAIVYFIGACKKSIVAHTALGILTVVFCLSMIAKTYFSNDIPVNSPFKLLCQFGIALCMLLVLCELRFDLGSGKPRAYMLISCLTFCINLCAVAANAVLTFKGMNEISVYSVPACAMVIYSAKMFLSHAHHETASECDADANSENTDTIENDHNEKGKTTDENIG